MRIGAEKEAHAWINDHALTRDTRALQNSEPFLEEADDRINDVRDRNVGACNVIGSVQGVHGDEPARRCGERRIHGRVGKAMDIIQERHPA